MSRATCAVASRGSNAGAGAACSETGWTCRRKQAQLVAALTGRFARRKLRRLQSSA